MVWVCKQNLTIL